MQPSRPLLCLLTSLTLIASCTAPPRPPSVDPSSRRPANTSLGIEMQKCSSALKNAQLLISENERLAERTTAVLAGVTAQQQWLAARAAEPPTRAGNGVYIVSFDFASTAFWLPTSDAQRLVNEARSAPFVAVRGRTDGTVDNAADSRIASQRANAVREFLVAAGIDPARIRTSYQPTGDHLADNSDAAGRALNRRVEIEIYRTMPVTTALPRSDK